MLKSQFSLFENKPYPLAERMRPRTLEEFVGQETILGDGTILKKEIMTDNLPSMILWGPPGCGKTTLVNIIASRTSKELYQLSAISAGVKEIKEALRRGVDNRQKGIGTILFLDEIHRLNKAQQDVLLADVETGNVTLIGATTENPSFEINRALLSRTRVVVFKALSDEQILGLLQKALHCDKTLAETGAVFSDECLQEIVAASGGDARAALNILEAAAGYFGSASEEAPISPEKIRRLFSGNAMVYDKKSDEHYQAISALHKSMRNSDPDAAVYWLARMLEAGEDPLYIARRLIRFASEDIGLAWGNALQTAVAVYQAVHFVGMPECTVNLTQAVIYFSLLPKSNSLYAAYQHAGRVARETSGIPVPLHLRNASTALMAQLKYGVGYQYAHDYPGGITNMVCMPEQLSDIVFYEPGMAGNEGKLREQLERIRERKRAMPNSGRQP